MRAMTDIGFVPIEQSHLPLLWEWIQRPHVARWWAHWMPPTQAETMQMWTSMIEHSVPERGYLVTHGGREVGYIESYRLSTDPEMAHALALDRDAVAADVFIADADLIGQGLGPQIVGRFYLRLMDESGLDLGVIDPEVDNARAIRAYEKAGFTFLKDVDSGQPRGRDHIMVATRAEIERAVTAAETS